MGAKSHVKQKLRRPMFKCDICKRKLLSSQALKTHKYSVHRIESTSKAPVKTVTKTKTIPKKVPVSVSKVIIPVIKTESITQVNSNQPDDKTKNLAPEKVTGSRKIQFECPKCNVMFPDYFQTYKHIQKYHCVNSKGQTVHPSSADLIKPMRVEMCGSSGDYTCMGCKQKFGSMQLFDLHVSGLHSEGVESLFFPSMSEFLSWKIMMQNKTNTTYLIFGKCNVKQTYRCTYLPPPETTSGLISHICPSSIVLQEFSKGIQVHFYKTHHGHICPEYVCSDKYKKYLITSLMQEKSPQAYDLVYNEKDLYCQFKVLCESIIVEAAKVKIDDLKLLLGKALEMTSVINSYDEDDDTFTHDDSKNISEDQVTKALESLKKFAVKRKVTNSSAVVSGDKKCKPKIVSAFSMADKTDQKEDTADNKPDATNVDGNVPSTRVLRNSQIQSPTFNDTYKDFVDKNFKLCVDGNVGGRRRISVPIRTPVENVRGLRVRPLSKLVDQKQIEEELAKDFTEETPRNDINNVTIKPRVVVNTNVTVKPPTNENKGPNSVPKPDTDVNFKDTKFMINKQFTPRNKPKKQVMKTKIGQFKPSFSPKSSPSPKKVEDNLNKKKVEDNLNKKKVEDNLNKSVGKIKPDIEYEVMEQENDCNILILKI